MTKVKVKDKLVKLKDTSEELPETKEMVKSFLIGEVVIADSNDLTRELYDKGRYGEPTESKKFQYSLIETLYLVERSKFEIFDNKNKIIDFDNSLVKSLLSAITTSPIKKDLTISLVSGSSSLVSFSFTSLSLTLTF